MKPTNTLRCHGDGVEIQLSEWTGEGAAVLCIHGLTSNGRCFDLLAEGLTPAHRVLAPDLRGRGLSDKPDTGYSIDHHARDIAAVIKELGLSKITILGHSLGAYIGLAVTAGWPEMIDRVILVDGGAPLNQEQWANVAEGIKPSLDRLKQSFPSFEEYVGVLKKFPVFQPWHEALDDYFRYESEEVDGMVRSRINPQHIEEERTNIVKTDTNVYYPKIKCPVLVLRATLGMFSDDDLVLPEPALKALVEALPQTRVINIEGVHHYSLVVQPNETRDRAIQDFLAE